MSISIRGTPLIIRLLRIISGLPELLKFRTNDAYACFPGVTEYRLKTAPNNNRCRLPLSYNRCQGYLPPALKSFAALNDF